MIRHCGFDKLQKTNKFRLPQTKLRLPDPTLDAFQNLQRVSHTRVESRRATRVTGRKKRKPLSPSEGERAGVRGPSLPVESRTRSTENNRAHKKPNIQSQRDTTTIGPQAKRRGGNKTPNNLPCSCFFPESYRGQNRKRGALRCPAATPIIVLKND